MRRIIWFARHPPLPSQVAALRRHFGAVEIIQDPTRFIDAKDILARFRAARGDELVLVAPLSVLAALCALGVQPLRAEMVAVDPAEAEVITHGRGYRFDRFVRVRGVILETEELPEMEEKP